MIDTKTARIVVNGSSIVNPWFTAYAAERKHVLRCARCYKCNEILAIGQPVKNNPKREGLIAHVDCMPAWKAGIDAGWRPERDPRIPLIEGARREESEEPPPREEEPHDENESDDAPPTNGAASGLDALGRALAEDVYSRIKGRLRIDPATIDATIVARLDALGESLRATIKREIETHATRIEVTYTQGEPPPTRTIEGTHKQFPELLRLAMMRSAVNGRRPNIFLHDCEENGGPGSGKSTAAMQLAEALGYGPARFVYANFGPGTPESRAFGHRAPDGRYVESAFYEAATKGWVFLADEVCNMPDPLATLFQGALASNKAAFPHAMVDIHPDFLFIAADQTVGLGGSGGYSARRKLNPAFRTRFRFLAWQYDAKLENAIAVAENPENGIRWADWVRTIRAVAKRDNLPDVNASPRAIQAGAMEIRAGAAALDVAKGIMFAGVPADTVKRILDSNPLPAF